MSQRVSYPPLIIFFDTILLILVILALNQQQKIYINLPKERVIKGWDIVVKRNGQFYKVINNNLEHIIFKKDYYLNPCSEQLECKNIKSRYPDSNIFVLLPDDTLNQVGKIVLFASYKNNCKKIIIDINELGKISDKINQENECIKDIINYELYNKKTSA